MRWIMTKTGERAHAVPSGAKQAMCGVSIAQAARIVNPQAEGICRCGACDFVWRQQGRANKPPKPPADLTTYTPRHDGLPESG